MSRLAIIGVLSGFLWALSGGAVGGEVFTVRRRKVLVTTDPPKCRRTIQRHSTVIATSSMQTLDSLATMLRLCMDSESSVAVLPDAKHERRCLVWTDTRLKRKGRWQIIAVQDARIDCPTT